MKIQERQVGVTVLGRNIKDIIKSDRGLSDIQTQANLDWVDMSIRMAAPGGILVTPYNGKKYQECRGEFYEVLREF